MTMNGGSTKTLHADPNVTPLIDVLLVLLIIFMVIVPVAPTGLAPALPQPPKKGEATPPQTIVVQVLASRAGPAYKINGAIVPNKRQLAAELHRIFSVRAEKVVFVQGGPQLDFASIAEVIDLTRAAGIDHVGILTSALAANSSAK
ncbi:MAG TPA: biopolymer transporter ExbD [Acidobacteriaceae bacterium]|jgi:biopolymer transport protein ExbD|nr:biopolymer transporter ExbD [Acidobacteriaceae bacterium]